MIAFSNNHLLYALTWGTLALMAAAGAICVSLDLLRSDRFGKAEAKLAVRLAWGETIEDIAEEHGISISTARVQLMSNFAKTGTSRQAELVSLLKRRAQLGAPRHRGS